MGKKQVKTMEVEYPVEDLEPETSEEEDEEEEEGRKTKTRKEEAREHKTQLERLKEKDPEFHEFLKNASKELLEFDVEEDDLDAGETEDDIATDVDDGNGEMEDNGESNDLGAVDKDRKNSSRVITTAMVEAWSKSVREEGKVGALRNLMKAFRIACHVGDDGGDESAKFSTMPSTVFNKIMLSVLSEMDGNLRNLLGLPLSGGKKETMVALMNTRKWKNYNHLVKSYLGNALHVLNQMTDNEMVSFTLRRLKNSSVLLAAFPSLLRKYIKVSLHFWGTEGGSLPVISFLFLRDLCVRMGSDVCDECFKGIYKAYVLNCQFINAAKLQHIYFLRNCVIELLRVDLPTAYQHAFTFIRQLAMILRDAITVKTKESFRKVYGWKFMSCLELWTGAVCTFSSEADFRPLAYPLTQVISGVARLVPTARYFPLRLRCVRMLNRIAAATGTFIPVSMLLLDMLEMKELNRPPTGGVGIAIDLRTTLKVKKPVLKTRSFQEACVFTVVEELAEHFAQWSYSVAFFELSFIPAVRLRNFTKSTKVDRFRKEMRQLIRQVWDEGIKNLKRNRLKMTASPDRYRIEANSQFTNEKRKSVTFLPNEPAAGTFLEAEKKAGASPLSQYVAVVRQRAQQRTEALTESSVVVGEHSSFGSKIPEADEDDDDADVEKGAAVFSTNWVPSGKPKANQSEEDGKKRNKSKKKSKGEHQEDEEALDEDIVEDLVLSSDEDDDSDMDGMMNPAPAKLPDEKQKPSKNSLSKKKAQKRWRTKSKAKRSPENPGGENLKPAHHQQKKRKFSADSTAKKNVDSPGKKFKKKKQ